MFRLYSHSPGTPDPFLILEANSPMDLKTLAISNKTYITLQLHSLATLKGFEMCPHKTLPIELVLCA